MDVGVALVNGGQQVVAGLSCRNVSLWGEAVAKQALDEDVLVVEEKHSGGCGPLPLSRWRLTSFSLIDVETGRMAERTAV